MGGYSLKSALETEDRVPKADHIIPIKSCLIRDDLHMRVHLRSKGHLLNPALKEIGWTRAKHLLQWHAENFDKNILFTDEKSFTIREQYNNQNNKIYAQTSLEVHSEGAGRSSPFLHHVLVGGVQLGGDTSSFLQERGETGVQVYKEDVLQGVVKHLNTTFFSGQEWVFQQDLVPTQKAKTTQEWLRRNLLVFNSTENWLSGSADLKTPDNKVWVVLEDMACQRHHNSLESLRRSPVKVAAEIPLVTERAATAEWSELLKACVKA